MAISSIAPASCFICPSHRHRHHRPPSHRGARLPSEDRSHVSADATEKELPLHLEELGDPENPVSDTKRQYIQHGLSSDEADFLLSLSEKEKSQIYRKVDFRLVPMLALLYLVSVNLCHLHGGL